METDMADVDGTEEAPEDMLGGDEMEPAAATETPPA
jgi:hypothetical protein